MRDFPVFTTDNGTASLILKEVPYRQIAYVRVQSAEVLQPFVEECAEFCKAVGAERVYACGHPDLEHYPFHTAIWKMAIMREMLPETDACLFPVLPETLESWRALYNRKMEGVPNAAFMDKDGGEKLLSSGEGYFVHRDRQLLGIGMVDTGSIHAVISTVKGGGQDVVAALCHAAVEDTITLEVASENRKAVQLYERLGFVRQQELSQWYQIF